MDMTAASHRNELLAALAPDDLARLQLHLVNVRLVRERVLVERGQAVERVFFIENGISLLVAQTGRWRRSRRDHRSRGNGGGGLHCWTRVRPPTPPRSRKYPEPPYCPESLIVRGIASSV